MTVRRESFFVLDGTVELLCGDQVITAGAGDLVVVPAAVPHAFAAARVSPAEMLVVVAPGVERFGFIRLLAQLADGTAAPADLVGAQQAFDTFIEDSPVWHEARRSTG